MFIKINFKKTTLLLLLLVVIILGVFLVTANEMPKYKGFMFMFLLLILSDFYLWTYAKRIVLKQRGLIKIILYFFFWLAMLLSLLFFAASVFINIKDWNPVFRTYLTGGMLVLYAPKIFAIIFLLIADFFRLLKFLHAFLFRRNKFTQKFPNKRWFVFLFMGNVGAFLIFSLLIWGMIFTEYDYQIKTIEIGFKKLPPSFDGLKIVQLSDMHLGSMYGEKPLKKAVELINDIKPDLIVFTGDLVNYTTDEAYAYKEILKQIKAPMGVYAILGNHDYGEYVKWEREVEKKQNMQEMIDFHRDMGWHLLMNENTGIQRDSVFIFIAGVENWGKSLRFPKKGDIHKAVQGIDTNTFVMLLSHDPSYWEENISKNYPFINLTLSGHTHGMQMGVAGDDFEWSPAQYISRYWAGLYRNENVKSQYLYVNRGLGVIGYPGRIGIKPEITLIKLKSIAN